MVPTTSYDNPWETGTEAKFLKRGIKFFPQQTTRSTCLKQNPAMWFKSMNNSTPIDPDDGTTNDHHQH
jgi:hypothetical protein